MKFNVEAGTLSELEEQLIRKALIETGGNISQTAKMIGMSRANLYRRMKVYDLLKDRASIGGDRSVFSKER